MTRRWSLIAVIAALAVALAVVLVNLGSGTAAGSRPADRTGRAAASSNLRGVGWWPAHEKAGVVAADAVGGHDAQLLGGASWTDGPHGGALLFNGSSGYADTGARLLDTVGGDYSVAAWVRLDAEGDDVFYTAVSEDGDKSSAFFLQYSGTDKRFSFSFANARALAEVMGAPVTGRWYHLAGTYSHADRTLSLYVDGALAGRVLADDPEVGSGHLEIGRGEWNGNLVDFWRGAVADVHAYARALSAGEVARLAAQEPGK